MILLSIHPEYVEKILSEVKGFEFRKKVPKEFAKDKRIAIYSTRPVCRIVAYVDVAHVLSGSPITVWRQTASRSGLDKKVYDTYFNGKTEAYAFAIAEVHKMAKPVTLRKVGCMSGAPQSFCYLNPRQIARIVRATEE